MRHLRLILISGLILGLSFSVVVNLLQARQLYWLQRNEGALLPGTTVPDVVATDSAGQSARISLHTSQPTIIYVFRPRCAWCGRNDRAINALVSKVAGRYHIAGLALDQIQLSMFLKAHQMPFPVYHDPSLATIAAYHLRTTPSTIVVGTDGKILRTFTGAYTETTKASLEKFFSITLPFDAGLEDRQLSLKEQ